MSTEEIKIINNFIDKIPQILKILLDDYQEESETFEKNKD